MNLRKKRFLQGIGIAVLCAGSGILGGAIEREYIRRTDTTPYRYMMLIDPKGVVVHDFYDRRCDTHNAFIRQENGLYDRASVFVGDDWSINLRSETGIDYGLNGESIKAGKKRFRVVARISETRPSQPIE